MTAGRAELSLLMEREMEQDRASGRATHEQSPTVSAVPVGIPDACPKCALVDAELSRMADRIYRYGGEHKPIAALFDMFRHFFTDPLAWTSGNPLPAAAWLKERDHPRAKRGRPAKIVAQGTEARRAATTGAVHDGPVRKDAPGGHSTLYGAEPDKDGEG